jgi:hypothetical protein
MEATARPTAILLVVPNGFRRSPKPPGAGGPA